MDKILEKIKKKQKSIFVFSIIIFFIFLLPMYYFTQVLFQEGNPINTIKALIKLETSKKQYSILEIKPKKYLTKRYNGISNVLKDEKLKLIDRFGAILVTRNHNNQEVDIEIRSFTRFYGVLEIKENYKISGIEITSETPEISFYQN